MFLLQGDGCLPDPHCPPPRSSRPILLYLQIFGQNYQFGGKAGLILLPTGHFDSFLYCQNQLENQGQQRLSLRQLQGLVRIQPHDRKSSSKLSHIAYSGIVNNNMK